MEKGETIETVVRNELCTGCGTCVALCPTVAIEMAKNDSKGIYVPQLYHEKCNECGICYQACPGHYVDFEQLNQAIFGREPEDILLGNYLNCYVGHATDYNIQYNSASGGLVTALLIFALQEGLVDGALVTGMSKKSPLEPQPFIATTREEIISASKSKYCPVPANIALNETVQSEGRFAVVGLPCHLQGIRKAEQVSKNLKERIILHLGLFCNHTPNSWGTEVLLKRLKVRNDEVIKLDYRGEGWPGAMKIHLKSEDLLLSLPDYWSFVGSDFFFPKRCLMCSDHTAELADMSFGDAWLSEFEGDRVGQSIVVSRTNLGEQFLQRMADENLVQLDQVTATEVKLTQAAMLHFKKKRLKARLKLFRKKELSNAKLLEPSLADYPLSLFPCFSRLLSQNRASRLLLEHVPRRLVSLYNLTLAIIYFQRIRQFKRTIQTDRLKEQI